MFSLGIAYKYTERNWKSATATLISLVLYLWLVAWDLNRIAECFSNQLQYSI